MCMRILYLLLESPRPRSYCCCVVAFDKKLWRHCRRPQQNNVPRFYLQKLSAQKAEGRKDKGGEFSITPDTLDVTFWHYSLLEKQ